MHARFFVPLFIICGVLFQLKAIAQDILVRYGCGTGCSVQQRQLSKVVLMPNDQRRVLVESQAFVATESGSRPCLPQDRCDGQLKQQWIIADCGDSPKINLGAFRSDGKDGYWFDVFDDNGRPLDTTASGYAYSHWKALCSSQNIENSESLKPDNEANQKKAISVPCMNGGGSGGWLFENLPQHYFPLTEVSVEEWPKHLAMKHPLYQANIPWNRYGTCKVIPSKYP